MTAKTFRRLALGFPEATEGAHMDHPDFRVRGKVFATLGPREDWGMVKLTPGQQAELISAQPAIFSPASGAWGRQGCTIVQLAPADRGLVEQALQWAWLNTAPRKLVDEYPHG
ncbi:MAG: MmcQ/YjbR family DNA-binding protein [Planctomycetales bacterium]